MVRQKAKSRTSWQQLPLQHSSVSKQTERVWKPGVKYSLLTLAKLMLEIWHIQWNCFEAFPDQNKKCDSHKWWDFPDWMVDTMKMVVMLNQGRVTEAAAQHCIVEPCRGGEMMLLIVSQNIRFLLASHAHHKTPRLRDGSRFQIGWIFGKVPNGLWPPPPHFRKVTLQIF